ncbi:hypothetical protein F4781DRAFT_386804 [Annulohypoxylon bovei var. microspora]|nr:hypothetical protein F4781DRAFT_386804 [Annulohypoxylon bovei var. microspora]
MVYIWPSNDIPRLNAYLLKDLSDDELKLFKKAFEFGAMSSFNPLLELIIQKAPEDYLGKPHSYIRTKEDEAGHAGPFVLIDEQVVLKGAVWYVERFADEDEVDNEQAESTDVLWKILIKTEHLPISYVNYEISNIDIQEDLDGCGVEFPAKVNFKQPQVAGTSEYDLDIADFRHDQPAYLTAFPGEYEETTDEEVLKNFAPPPDRVGRLKEDVAKETGIKSSWTSVRKAEPKELPDGTTKEFPEGSINLLHKYDPDFAWPPYEWPEKSL